ncbi:UDP-3-O-(3-hydroxymyristoyl)glucosamine N-acyltransferase [Usitatibacter rugosus]|uniref:UDP-3-O-(3-hydroxymyristoyl)glucosamine N-acyltransferase n=1 Tax=Usitatibacter rugosus TaxID=2732067 RepID=A0A6M4H039_9PROT|nr:acyltransferase [Usitatibacter rugosus]QJR12685.1 UDP-3-O-(3-hydroxymyristoyl)glucosamine N-acyltransferase [Usitatibacter rugosus]
MTDSDVLSVDPTAWVSPDARIHPSQRGTRIVIGAHTQVYDYVVIRAVGGTGDIVIGEHCYINPHCVLYSGSGIRFGDYVLIGPHCSIVPANHGIARTDEVIRKQGFMPSRGGVVIEDDVWLGAHCVVLDGTHIESGAVIAAGSVVSGRITGKAVWGGNPCRLIRPR